jgi:gliding motility-associated-like protein
MKFCLILISITLINISLYSQIISVHSIANARQPATGTNGYTLDGMWMANTRPKLLSTSNFGTVGTYSKSISIYDGYANSGSLTGVSPLPLNTIFFFAAFNKLDVSTQVFTSAEIDSLYNWSVKGGKIIIAQGGTYSSTYNGEILDSKWGFSYQSQVPSSVIPNANGSSTDIFNGPFGIVTSANEGGGAQGYFNGLPVNSQVLATDGSGNPTLFMDCNTLDLIIADIDVFTNFGGISGGGSIVNQQDKIWANIFVFMDKLQGLPQIIKNNDTLSVNTGYNNYQWYYNNNPINGAISPSFTTTQQGTYYAEVMVNGGCKIKSDSIKITKPIPQDTTLVQPDVLLMPNIFTPNNDGVNDFFNPAKNIGMLINQASIFNRWGTLVHECYLPKNLWDGKIGNENAVDGTYFWIIEYQNSKGEKNKMKGFLQLLR